MAAPGGISKDKYTGMKSVKLPCREGKTRCRYLEVETTKKIFKENIPNTSKENISHGYANKYCIFKFFTFLKVNMMHQRFEGKVEGDVGVKAFRVFALPDLELCKENQCK